MQSSGSIPVPDGFDGLPPVIQWILLALVGLGAAVMFGRRFLQSLTSDSTDTKEPITGGPEIFSELKPVKEMAAQLEVLTGTLAEMRRGLAEHSDLVAKLIADIDAERRQREIEEEVVRRVDETLKRRPRRRTSKPATPRN